MNVIASVLVVLIQTSLVLATLEVCYFCNTEVHGEGCEAPIDADSIQVQNCVDSDIVIDSNQYSSKVKQFFVDQNKIQASIDTKNTRTYNATCIYMTYNFSGRNVSARGCELESIDTSIGLLDICEYYRQIVPTRIENFACGTCNSDLCNDRVYEEESENEGDGANVFSVSFTMLMTMLLASFHM